MQRKVRKQPTGFTQVTNLVLNDPLLSWKAKGIYAYIYSKPDGWDFSARRIAKDAKDGNDGTISGIRELEEAGYIKRERHGDGRVSYHILVDPNTEKPEVAIEEPNTENPKEGKAHLGKIPTVSNKEVKVIKSTNNKDTALAVGVELYGEYKNVKLTVDDMADLTNQLGRDVLDDLIEQLSRYLETTKTRKYKGKTHRAVIQTWARRRKDRATSNHKTFSVIG